MASSFYPTIFQHMLKGDVDLDSPTVVKLLLLNSTYSFDATDNDVADLSGELANGSGGVAGYERKTIETTLSQDISGSTDADAGCFINFALTGAGAATWTSATFTCRSAVMYIEGATDADSKLLYFFDFVNDQTVSSGTFSLLDPNPQPKLRRYTA